MLTVSQLVAQIKHLVEDDQALANVWIEGEVSNFKQATSGHCYFTLKDAKAVMPCVMWRNDAARLRRLPLDGEHVQVHGYVSVYDAQGKLQFYADVLQPAGLGRLYQELEMLKARLAAEGLFDLARKRPLPPWPRRIGVVTSPQAAALRDVLRTLAARYPPVDVLLAPAAVQGAEAPPQIVAAIAALNAWSARVKRVDLIIVARGGGSLEELWAFNDERVVRAIAASSAPVVSGVGHETDVTLADLAADLRAPTPTGAATLVVPDRLDLVADVEAWRIRLTGALDKRLAAERRQVAQNRRLLARLSPRSQIAGRRQQVDDLGQGMSRVMRQRLQVRRAHLDGLHGRLLSLDPLAVLQRGYAVVQRQDNGRIVTSVGQVAAGDRLRIVVGDGQFDSTVSD